MRRERTYGRRQILRLAGSTATAVTVLLAGCGGPENEEDPDLPAEEGTGNGQEREGEDPPEADPQETGPNETDENESQADNDTGQEDDESGAD